MDARQGRGGRCPRMSKPICMPLNKAEQVRTGKMLRLLARLARRGNSLEQPSCCLEAQFPLYRGLTMLLVLRGQARPSRRVAQSMSPTRLPIDSRLKSRLFHPLLVIAVGPLRLPAQVLEAVLCYCRLAPLGCHPTSTTETETDTVLL